MTCFTYSSLPELQVWICCITGGSEFGCVVQELITPGSILDIPNPAKVSNFTSSSRRLDPLRSPRIQVRWGGLPRRGAKQRLRFNSKDHHPRGQEEYDTFLWVWDIPLGKKPSEDPTWRSPFFPLPGVPSSCSLLSDSSG